MVTTGGGIEQGETPEQADRRDLQEEVSFVPSSLNYIGHVIEPKRGQDVFVYWSYVTKEEKVTLKLGDDDGPAIGWFSIDEARSLPLVPSLRWYLEKFGDEIKKIVEDKQVPTVEMLGLTS